MAIPNSVKILKMSDKAIVYQQFRGDNPPIESKVKIESEPRYQYFECLDLFKTRAIEIDDLGEKWLVNGSVCCLNFHWKSKEDYGLQISLKRKADPEEEILVGRCHTTPYISFDFLSELDLEMAQCCFDEAWFYIQGITAQMSLLQPQ